MKIIVERRVVYFLNFLSLCVHIFCDKNFEREYKLIECHSPKSSFMTFKK